MERRDKSCFQSKSPDMGTFCGSEVPSLIRSSGNSLRITLTSDDADTGKGFQAVWRAVSNNISEYSKVPCVHTLLSSYV